MPMQDSGARKVAVTFEALAKDQVILSEVVALQFLLH